MPQTPKELSSFLGFTGFYESFIPEYSSLTSKLNTQKMIKSLDWTEDMDRQLRTLKEHFSKCP